VKTVFGGILSLMISALVFMLIGQYVTAMLHTAPAVTQLKEFLMPVSTVDITATLETIFGAVDPTGTAALELQNIATGTLTIPSESVIVNTTFVATASAGAINFNVYPNDAIYSAGVNNTFYKITFKSSSGQTMGSLAYKILSTNGVVQDLSNISPMNSTPARMNPLPPNAVQTNPTGQQTISTYPINLGAGLYLLNGDTGISRTAAGVIEIGNGSAGDASGTVNAAEYKVAGSQIAAANLADGTTGTGAIVKAASPTLSGTATVGTLAATTIEEAALSGTFTGNPAFTGSPTTGLLNNFFFVDGTKYANLAAAVAAAQTAGGGTVVTAMPETFATNPFPGAGNTTPIRIIFSVGTWKTNVALTIGDAVIVEGAGGGQVNGTQIQAVSGTFPTNTPVITFGNGGNGIFHSRLVNINVDAQNIAGSTCVFSSELNENSGLRDVGCWNYGLYGVNIDATSGSPAVPAAHYIIEKISLLQLAPTSGSISTTIGLRIKGNAGDGPWAVRDVSIVAGKFLACVYIDDIQTGVFESFNLEPAATSVNGILFGTDGVNGITLMNIQTPSGNTTNVINFNGVGNQISILGVLKGGSTNAILDSLRSVTLTDGNVPIYVVGNSNEIISMNPGINMNATTINASQFNVAGSQIATTNLSDVAKGTTTVTANSLTQTGGSATLSGHYSRVGNIVTVNVSITPITSTTSTAGTSFLTFTGLPGNPARIAAGAVGAGGTINVGACMFSTNGDLFLPSWSALTGVVHVTVTYELS
jgi:hypothetical protein